MSQNPSSSPAGLPAKLGIFLSNTVKKVDRFGYPISMTFNNEQTYKSVFGGTMTLLSTISIIAYLAVNVHTAVTRAEYKSTRAHRIRNVYLENTVIPIDQSNFDYAVQLSYKGPVIPNMGIID